VLGEFGGLLGEVFGLDGVVCPGAVVPGDVVFGAPLGEVLPGLCVFGVGGLVVPSGVVVVFGVPVPGAAVPAGGVAVPGGGVGGPAGGVAVLPGGVAVPGPGTGAAVVGEAVPAGGVAAPGVELCPAVPDPPAGAVPPAGALCATTQLAQHRITDNNTNFVFDIFGSPQFSNSISSQEQEADFGGQLPSQLQYRQRILSA